MQEGSLGLRDKARPDTTFHVSLVTPLGSHSCSSQALDKRQPEASHAAGHLPVPTVSERTLLPKQYNFCSFIQTGQEPSQAVPSPQSKPLNVPERIISKSPPGTLSVRCTDPPGNTSGQGELSWAGHRSQERVSETLERPSGQWLAGCRWTGLTQGWQCPVQIPKHVQGLVTGSRVLPRMTQSRSCQLVAACNLIIIIALLPPWRSL